MGAKEDLLGVLEALAALSASPRGANALGRALGSLTTAHEVLQVVLQRKVRAEGRPAEAGSVQAEAVVQDMVAFGLQRLMPQTSGMELLRLRYQLSQVRKDRDRVVAALAYREVVSRGVYDNIWSELREVLDDLYDDFSRSDAEPQKRYGESKSSLREGEEVGALMPPPAEMTDRKSFRNGVTLPLASSSPSAHENLDNLEKEKKELEQQLQAQKGKYESLVERLHSSFEERIESVVKDYQETVTEVKDVKTALVEERTKREQTREQLISMESVLEDAQKIIQELRERLERQAEVQKEEMWKFHNLLSAIGVSSISDAAAKLKKLQDRLSKGEAEHSRGMKILSSIQDKLGGCDVNDVNKKVESLQQKLLDAEGYQKKIATLQNSIQNLQNRMKDREVFFLEKKAEHEKTKEDLDSLEKELEERKRNEASKHEQFQKELEVKTKRIKELEIRIKSLEHAGEEQSSLQEESGLLQAELGTLRASFERMQSATDEKIRSLSEQLQESEKTKEALEKEFESRNENLAKIENENEALIQQVTELREIVSGKSADLHSASTQSVEIQQRFENLKVEFVRLQRENENVTRRMDHLQEENETLKNEFERNLTEELETLREEILEKTAALNSALAESNELRQNHQELCLEIAKIREENVDLKAERHEPLQNNNLPKDFEFQQSNAEEVLRKELKEKVAILESARVECDEMRRNEQELRSEIENLRTETKGAEARKAKKLQPETDTLQKMESSQDGAKRVQTLQKEIECLHAELERNKNEFEKMLSQKEDEVRESMLPSMQRTIKSWQEKYEKDMEEAIAKSNSKIEELEEELGHARNVKTPKTVCIRSASDESDQRLDLLKNMLASVAQLLREANTSAMKQRKNVNLLTSRSLIEIRALRKEKTLLVHGIKRIHESYGSVKPSDISQSVFSAVQIPPSSNTPSKELTNQRDEVSFAVAQKSQHRDEFAHSTIEALAGKTEAKVEGCNDDEVCNDREGDVADLFSDVSQGNKDDLFSSFGKYKLSDAPHELKQAVEESMKEVEERERSIADLFSSRLLAEVPQLFENGSEGTLPPILDADDSNVSSSSPPTNMNEFSFQSFGTEYLSKRDDEGEGIQQELVDLSLDEDEGGVELTLEDAIVLV